MNKLMRVIRKWLLRFRLRRILRAVGFTPTREQREIILNPKRPYLYGWPRRSGKSTTACLWLLLHRKETMKGRSPVMEIPDPDILVSHSFERWTYVNLRILAEKCRRKRIRVCAIPASQNFPPWPREVWERSARIRLEREEQDRRRLVQVYLDAKRSPWPTFKEGKV